MIAEKDIIKIKDGKPNIGVSVTNAKYLKELEIDIDAYCKNQIKLLDFRNKYGFDYSELIMWGDTTKTEPSEMKQLIESTPINEFEKRYISYKCFCGEEYGLDWKSSVLHGTVKSSYDCLMTHLNNPRYLIVFNLDEMKKRLSVQKRNEENGK